MSIDVSIVAQKKVLASNVSDDDDYGGPLLAVRRNDGNDHPLLSDKQLRVLSSFSGLVSLERRDEYENAVLSRIAGGARPGDAAVQAACAQAATEFVAPGALRSYGLVGHDGRSDRTSIGNGKETRLARGATHVGSKDPSGPLINAPPEQREHHGAFVTNPPAFDVVALLSSGNNAMLRARGLMTGLPAFGAPQMGVGKRQRQSVTEVGMTEKIVSDRIRELDAERLAIKEEAIERAKVAISDLRLLGFGFKLVEEGGRKRRVKAEAVEAEAVEAEPKKRSITAAVCPVCQFQTDPPHDGRNHRGQAEKCRFSAAELRERGLVRV